MWNGGAEARLKPEREEKAVPGVGPSGIPVRGPAPDGGAHKMMGGRTGLPVPCQTFPACHRNGGERGGACFTCLGLAPELAASGG